MQEELCKVLASPTCNIKNISLLQGSLKSDFLQRLQAVLQSNKSNKSMQPRLTEFNSINLSRNQIEDKGLIYLANIFKEFPKLCNLTDLCLSKCSIGSKSLNTLLTSSNLGSTLKHLDLSYNSLKDEPTVT